MSTTVDERVVSMRFDNQHFEKNVQTTMSTLDKLKQKLRLDGSSKGLENVDKAAKKVDMTHLGKGIETVQAKFSTLEVMGVTALANITNSAVNAGKKMISALTIDPVMTGFQEYETQMNAVQTILANTQSKGSTLDDVNNALDTLNTYADQTIYNFTEMTRNIGTFTAAGVDLQTSVDSIKGIANLAAVSGSSSQQASTAMYQLSQALAAGKVSLMDWNSVVNAGMGGELFQNALIRTSELLKTGAKDAINTYGSFRESLTRGEWLTTEVLTETLKQLSGSYTEADLIAQGYTEEQAKEIAKLAETASDAATDVKTFSQLWDVMKESAQSGWAQTWKLLVGDFEQAKALLKPLAEFFTGEEGIITKMSDARNKLLESALGKGLTKAFDSVNNVLGKTQKGIDGVLKPVNAASKALEDLGSIADKVILGSFGNGEDRFKALSDAGYNYYKVQNKVNETLGNSFRHSEKTIAAQDKLLGKQTESTEKTDEQKEATVELTEANKKQLKTLLSMTEAQLRARGYTDEQIESLQALGKQAKDLGIPLNEFIDNLDKINGRWLLINSFKNIGQGIVAVFKSMGEAWREIFDPITADQLFGFIAGLHKLTSYLRVNEEAADKFKRTFKGVFAALDIVLTVVGGPLKIAFKALTQLLGMFGFDILDVTAYIGDAIVGFRDWIDSTLDFTKAFEVAIPYITKFGTSVKGWIDGLREAEDIPKYIADSLIAGIDSIKTFIGDLDTYITEGIDKIPSNIIAGITGGLWKGISSVANAILEIGKNIITKICEVLGIHSPSVVMYDIGTFTIEGFINGIKSAASGVWETIKDFGEKCVSTFKDIDLGKIYALGASLGMVFGIFKIGKLVETALSPLEGLGNVLEAVAGVVESVQGTVEAFTGVLKSFSTSIKAKAIKDIAIALAILVGSIAVLTFLDGDKVKSAVITLLELAAIIGVLSIAVGKFGSSNTVSFGKFAVAVLGISASLLIMAAAIKVMESVDPERMTQALEGLFAMVGALAMVLIAYGALNAFGGNLDGAGKTLLKMSLAMLLLVVVIKLIAGLDPSELAIGGMAITAFGGIIVGLIAATKLAGKDIDKLGSTLVKMSLAMMILVGVIKAISGMNPGEIAKGLVVIVAFGGIITGLIAATKLAGNDLGKIGGTLVGISAAMMLMTLVMKMVSGMSVGDIAKGLIVITLFGGIITGLIAATKLAGKDLKGVASTILAMSVSIGILAGVAVLLSLMDTAGLAKGIIAIGALAAIMALMVVSTKNAQDCKSNLIVMTVAIGVMVGAVALLSMIDGSKLAGATAALSMVMGMFALMTAASGKAQKSMGALIVMSLAIALMGTIIWQLSQLPIESTIGSAVALSTLLLAVSGALLILSLISKKALSMLGGVVALAAMAIPLRAFVWVLSEMQGVENAMNNVQALALLTGCLSVMLLPLCLVGTFIGQAILGVVALTAMVVPLRAFVWVLSEMQGVQNAMNNVKALSLLTACLSVMLLPLSVVGLLLVPALLGVVALTAMVVPLRAFVWVLSEMQNIQNATANVELLIGLLTTVSGVLIQIALVGPLALMGVAALAGLTALMVGLGALAVGIGALTEKFPQLEEFLDKGIPILEKLAYGIGSFIGNLINGFMSGVAEGLPEIGIMLSQFMMNVMPFIAGAKLVDEQVLAGVGILAAAILALTAAELITGVASFLTGGSSFAELGAQLSAFMTNAKSFIAGAMMIKPEMMEGVKTLAETILILTGANLLDGISKLFGGDVSLGSFGAQLAEFGPHMKTYAESVQGLNEETLEAMKVSAEAGKLLAEMASKMPNTGGLLGEIFGENDVDTFGQQLEGLGKSLVKYGNSVVDLQTEAVENSIPAAEALTELADSIPNSGGFIAEFFGDNSIDTFGLQLEAFGLALKSYGDTVADLNTEAIETSVGAAESLSDLADSLPASGGFITEFVSDSSMSAFGTDLISFGEALTGYAGSVSELDVDSITASVTAAEALSDLASALPESGGFMSVFTADNDLSTFGSELKKFGKALKGYSDAVGEINTSKLANSTTQFNRIANIARGLTTANIDNLGAFGTELGKLGKAGVDKFIKAFDDAASKVQKAGKKMINNITNGVSSESKTLSSKFKSVASDSVTAVRDKYQSFYNAGSYLVTGFANGISENDYKAEAKARAMAKAAAEAAEEALDINSPSKVFRKIGKSVPEGFALGIEKYSGMVNGSSEYMADTAISSFRKSLNRMGDIVNGDVDVQPTIRPVLDLSDVTAGANSISGLFDMNPSVGVLANVRAINSGMSTNQNGNSELVSAISDLKKSLNTRTGDTYNIDGITYDDGSNIATAVQSIVRAARMERRV